MADKDVGTTHVGGSGRIDATRVAGMLDQVRAAGFTAGAPLGAGGMGRVLVARDQSIQRDVALKMLFADAPPSSVARFLREARITGMLEHPNIVPVYALGVDAAGEPYYAMKRVRGRSLEDLLDDIRGGGKDPGLPFLIGALQKICDAVAFAHAQGVIHRDLKPANVMVGDFGEVLVMDWGLAKVLGPEGGGPTLVSIDALPPADLADAALAIALERVASETGRLTVDGAAVGSPNYMAPEQALGELDRVGRASDIYALGGLLYEIVALVPPVSGRSAYDVRQNAAQGKIDDPVWLARKTRPVPKDLAAIAMKALAFNPARRYPSVAALRDDLDRWLAHLPVSARTRSWREGATALVRRHPAGMVAAVAVVVAVAVALGAVLALGTPGAAPTPPVEGAPAPGGQSAERTAHHLADVAAGFFAPLGRRVATLADLGRSGHLPFDDRRRMNDAMFGVLSYEPSIVSINVGSDAGHNHMALARTGGAWFVRSVSPGERPLLIELAARDAPEKIARADWDYDPRTRAWYRAAGAVPEGAVAWTAPYLFQTTKDPGISAAVRWTRDGHSQVVALDVLLGELTRGLRAAASGTHMLAVVLDADARVLALPAHPRFDDPEVARAATTQNVDAIGIEAITRGWAAWRDAGRPPAASRFDVGGARWWVAGRRIEVDGLAAVVVVVDAEE